jgi:FkbM family methyltransferase
MNMKRFQRYRPGWDWKGMVGSAACIKWCFRDLENLDAALGQFSRRRVAVQAGGNIGIFAKRLAEEFAVVHTFEPDSSLYAQLLINATEKNIVAHRVALGDCAASVGMSCVRRDSSGREAHEGLTHVAGAGDIPMRTLDSYCLDHCDLLYLDIEGYELKALRGAVQTIERCRPVIGVEVNGSCEYYGDSCDAVRRLIIGMNYCAVLQRNSDEVFVPEECAR